MILKIGKLQIVADSHNDSQNTQKSHLALLVRCLNIVVDQLYHGSMQHIVCCHVWNDFWPQMTVVVKSTRCSFEGNLGKV